VGKDVLLVDDSIVRGTTSKEIIQMAKEAGAKSVIFASCAPPIRHSNVYGIDMPSRTELVAYKRTLDEIARHLGADVVIYQTLPDLVDSVTQLNPNLARLDCSVFDGVYVTGYVDEDYLAQLEQVRNDSAKEKAESMNGGMVVVAPAASKMNGFTNGARAHDHRRTMSNGYPAHPNGKPLLEVKTKIPDDGCSGPMRGLDDTVGLYNSWSASPIPEKNSIVA